MDDLMANEPHFRLCDFGAARFIGQRMVNHRECEHAAYTFKKDDSNVD